MNSVNAVAQLNLFLAVSEMLANFVPILFFICSVYMTEVSSKEPQAMQIFTAGDPDLYRWFHMIASVKIASPDEADMKLWSESCNSLFNSKKAEYNHSICEAYHLAMNANNCVGIFSFIA